MKRCETCRYWTQETNPWLHLPKTNLGSCAAPKIQYGYRHGEVADDGARVENDEGWGMLTGPQFGCVLHEDRSA